MKILLSVILLPLFSAMIWAAPVVEVTTVEDEVPGSLRQGLLDVDEGGVLTFSQELNGQTILLTAGVLPINRSVTIDASSLEDGITISGGNVSGVLEVTGVTDLALNHITISDGYPISGVGLIGTGFIEMNQCSILDSHSEGRGGGVYVGGGSELLMVECLIQGNSGEKGGGIYNDGYLRIMECTFRSNEGREDGGGLYNSNIGLIRRCLFVENTARENGGAMLSRKDTYLQGCTLVDNAALDGGGIYCTDSLELEYCTVVGNSAEDDYGAFYVRDGIKLFDTIISDNSEGGDRTEITDGLIEDSPTSYIADGAPLDPLGDYGGPTLTMRPTGGSDGLIDQGEVNPIIETDARGEVRKVGSATDIGAAEYQGETREELLELPDGDPDGDSVETLLEVAMGRDPLFSDFDSPRRLKIERDGNSAKITFGIDPDYAEEIELTLSVTVGVEGLEVLLTNEEIRAVPLTDGIFEYDLELNARTKFYQLNALFVTEQLGD